MVPAGPTPSRITGVQERGELQPARGKADPGRTRRHAAVASSRELRPALLLLLCACFASHAAAQQPSSLTSTSPAPYPSAYNATSTTVGNFARLNVEKAVSSKVYKACVYAFPPLIYFDNVTNTFGGYEWELFQTVSKSMGLSYTAQIMEFYPLIMGMLMPPGSPLRCDIGPTAFPISPAFYPLVPTPGNFLFSVPTFSSGSAIVTTVTYDSYDRWGFGRVFTPALWATLLGTAVVLAVLTYAAERDYCRRGLGKTKYPTALRPGMYEALYNTTGKLFNVVQDLKVTSLSGKLVSMGWGFLVLVVSTTYTACVTATLTAQNFKTTISGVKDLPFYNVIAPSLDTTNYLRFGFIPERIVLEREADLYGMLDRVSSGTADALIFSYPWLKYQTALRCDLAIVGDMFSYSENAVAFNADTPASFINEYNAQLVALKQQGVYEDLEAKYFTPQSSVQCPAASSGSIVVALNQLQGLWIILGAMVGLAVIVLILPYMSPQLEPDIKRTNSMYNIRGLSRKFVDLATKSFTTRDAADGKDIEVKNNPAFETDAGAQPADRGAPMQPAGRAVEPDAIKAQEPSTAHLVGPGSDDAEIRDKANSVMRFNSGVDGTAEAQEAMAGRAASIPAQPHVNHAKLPSVGHSSVSDGEPTPTRSMLHAHKTSKGPSPEAGPAMQAALADLRLEDVEDAS